MGHSTLHQRAWFLAKTDPETYSIGQFSKEKQTIWDGVKNPQALRAIREMRTGDRVFIYHSMGNAAVVGFAEVALDAVHVWLDTAGAAENAWVTKKRFER